MIQSGLDWHQLKVLLLCAFTSLSQFSNAGVPFSSYLTPRQRSLGFSSSANGLEWSAPEVALRPRQDVAWEAEEINRPFVLLLDGKYSSEEGKAWGNGRTVHMAGGLGQRACGGRPRRSTARLHCCWKASGGAQGEV